MKNFNRAISKLLLIATTIICSTQYVEASTKEITLNDFNKAFLDKCGVINDTTTDVMTNNDFGKIFYPLNATGVDRQFIKYDGSYCFDLQTMINNKITKESSNYVIKFSERG